MPQDFGQFRKCALQVNPWNSAKAYQGGGHALDEAAYNAALAQGCRVNGIEVVGIADHGSVEGMEALRAVLEAAGVVVFPGFEIASAEKVHMVCLYPAGTSSTVLNQYLGALGVPAVGPRTDPSSLRCLDIAAKVLEQGGFWYAAHVTGASGLLRLQQDGGGLHHTWRDSDKVLAAQIPADLEAVAPPEAKKILQNKNPDYRRDRPVALLNAKDVRRPEDLDHVRACSWIKMTPPTLEALRLACRDPESRVRLGDQVDPSYYSRIDRITFQRGYLDEVTLELSPNLNALVGGRGTGKSTVIEAIRYVLDAAAMGEARKVHNEIITENFAKEKASIEIAVTSFQHGCEQFVLTRLHGSPVVVTNAEGHVVALSPRDLLPTVEVYGQNELLAIVKDETAKAKLLARFLTEDEAAQTQLARLRRDLEENRNAIDRSEQQLVQLDEQLLQLPSLQEKVRALEKLELKAALEQVRAREAQRATVRALAGQWEALREATDTFRDAVAAVDVTQADPAVVDLAQLADHVRQAQKELAAAAAGMEPLIASTTEAFESGRDRVQQRLQSEEAAFFAAVEQLPAYRGKKATELTAEYQRLAGELARLTPLRAQRAAADTRRAALVSDRATLLGQLQAARSERWTALGRCVKSLNRRLDGQLKIEFEPERVRAPLAQFLRECKLPNVGDAKLKWVEEASTLSVATLVAHIRSGVEVLLEAYKDAGLQKSAAEALVAITPATLRRLEELELPERVQLMLNVSRDGQTFREVGRLSTGQQCTAVLHLLLLDNRDPLLIDQPEDNLDNAFIAEHIVNELRATKTRRQYLFATHNANIPVFGDAEWIGVLQEEDGHARLVAAGSIDHAQVKQLATNILEGGAEAFQRRREKYGL
jgi:DNA repair ATPase RecN